MISIKRCVVVYVAAIVILGSNASLGEASKDFAKNVKNLPAKYNPEVGMDVAYVVEDLKQLDVFVAKLGPGKHSNTHKRLYEELIYIIDGKGYTLIWKNEQDDPIRVNWEAGDFLSPPVNFKYQHFNVASTQQAALFHVTTKPLIEIMYGSEFATSVDYSFNSIWDEFVSLNEAIPTGLKTEAYVEMKGGFLVKNIDDMPLPYNRPGHYGIAFTSIPGANTPGSNMAGNRITESFIFDLEPPSGSPYNRHPWEVVYFVLKGSGAALVHMEGQPPEYIQFEEGDVYYERSNKWHWHSPLQGSKYRIIQLKANGYFNKTMGVQPEYRSKPASFDKFFKNITDRM